MKLKRKNETNSCYLGKINKIHESLASLTKLKGEDSNQ